MAPTDRSGADPSNLWGNAREGSEVPTELTHRAAPPQIAAPGDAFRASGVGHDYTGADGRAVRALDDLSLRAAPGELVAVVGPSGCGKSTLLELVCGLQPLQRGTLTSLPAVLMP